MRIIIDINYYSDDLLIIHETSNIPSQLVYEEIFY